MARFAFRFDPLYRVLGLPFGVTPGTSLVEVSDDHLVVRFGPWHLRTPVANVVGCERSGPYSVWKTAGPARLSLADRGVSFATNRDAGLCIRSPCLPVPAIDGRTGSGSPTAPSLRRSCSTSSHPISTEPRRSRSPSFSERRPKGDGPEVGSEYEIRMPGPWHRSVRTVARTPTSIRLATLDGHMEAGQIEFRTSWADSHRPSGLPATVLRDLSVDSTTHRGPSAPCTAAFQLRWNAALHVGPLLLSCRRDGEGHSRRQALRFGRCAMKADELH